MPQPSVKQILTLACTLSALFTAGFTAPVASAAANQAPVAQVQQVVRPADQKWSAAGEKNFTGKVSLTNLFAPDSPARSYGALVTFEPGAHTAWHLHPLGQKLYVTAGHGFTQYENGQVQELHPGDLVICPPGVRHWHGAALNESMTHLAIGENAGGPGAQWFDKICPDEYRALLKDFEK